MREYTAPATIAAVADDENMSDVVWVNAERFGDTVSFRRQLDGSWRDITAREFAAQVLSVAKGLVTAGIEPGDRVALMSRTRYEWTLIDFAIWGAGASPCPSTRPPPPSRSQWILADSGANA